MSILRVLTPAQKGAALAAAVTMALPVVQKAEGLALDPYWDIVHVRTYCYGETEDVQERRYTRAECEARLTRRLHGYGRSMQACLGTATVPVLASFTSFGYNVGVKAACGSTPARLIRAGNTAAGCDALRMWNKAGGKVRKGLVNRREQERAVCLRGVTP